MEEGRKKEHENEENLNGLRLKKEPCLYGIDIRIIIRNKVKKKKKTSVETTYGKTCNNFGKT